MAGDEIVWKQYCIENGRSGLGWHDFLSKMSDSQNDFWNNYRYDYRMKHNLPSRVAKRLNSKHNDIAIDGNSNDKIAFSTINYFLNISPVERKNYHACIGWTTTSRLMKFSKISNSYFNLHINHIGGETNPILQELKDYLMIALGKSYDEDFFMNFMKNIIMLENFCIANDITYTFYKSLGTPQDTAPTGYVALSPPYTGHILTDKITNHDNWMRFDDEYLPYMGHSWTSAILKKHEHLYVSKTNGHPNVEAAEALSEMIKTKIISQQVGFN
jgi:hypothetical protein